VTSRERVLAAIEHRPVDRVPLCFEGICHGTVRCVNARYPDPLQRARHYLALGVDHALRVSAPSSLPADVEVRQWEEQQPDEPTPVLVKEYSTSRGVLRQVVRKTPDYPHTEIPLCADHNVPPSRSKEYLVATEADLPKLECILKPPGRGEIARFREQAEAARDFCEETGILLAGGYSGLGTMVFSLSGIEGVLVSALSDAGFLEAYMAIVARWNQAMLEILVDAGVDLVVRRGWYESTDFWSPDLYRRFLLEPLREQVAAAHQADVKVVYVMNSGAMPLLSIFRELGFDVLSNIDPLASGTDVGRMKAEIGDRICLCGGVNNTRVLEQGSVADVDRAVREAVDALAPGSGFILAPGDSPGYVEGTDQAIVERNVRAMVEAWRDVCREY